VANELVKVIFYAPIALQIGNLEIESTDPRWILCVK